MNILIDIRTLMDAQYSGVSEYTYNLVKALLKLDHPSTSSGQAENEYQLFSNAIRTKHRLTQTYADLRENNRKVRVMSWRYPNKILNYFLFKFLNWPKIDSKPDADIFFMPHINFIGLAGRAKSVLTIHDLSFLRYGEFFSARKNFWHKMINVKKLVQRFDIIVAVSENTKRDVVELGGVAPEKVKVIYPGLGGEFLKSEIPASPKLQRGERNPKSPPDFATTKSLRAGETNINSQKLKIKNKYNLPEKFILFVGNLEPRKNVDGLIAAYGEMRKSSKDVEEYKLVIVGGKGWKSGRIYEAWQKSPYKDDIKFLGYIPKEEKPYLYNLASLFVFPSFYEGFGFPPLEAMACGVPVVTSFSSSLPEVVSGAALMVDPYNIADIARAMEQVLLDEGLRNNLIEKGLARAKQFSWEKTAGEYLELFNSLVDK